MITPDPHMGGTSRSSSDIESDIRRTRSRMDSTLDELSSQLTLRSVLHTLLDLWEARKPETPRAAARSRRVYGAVSQQLAHQVRENPIPSLLIGAGIAWAIYDKTRSHELYEEVDLGNRRYRVDPSVPAGPKMRGEVVTEYEYQDLDYDEIKHGPGMMDKAKEKLAEGKEAVSDAAHSAREKISELGAAAREKFSDAGETARGKAGEISDAAHEAAHSLRGRARDLYHSGKERGTHMGERMHHGYDRGAERFSEAVDEYPLGVGIGFAALGALVGLLLPHTRKEDELLGERSDEILDKVKQKGRETLDRTKMMAGKVAESAVDEARRQGFTAEAAKEKLSEVAAKAGEVAKKAKEEASSAVHQSGLSSSQQGQQSPPQSEPIGTGMPATGVETGQSKTMPPKSSSSQGV